MSIHMKAEYKLDIEEHFEVDSTNDYTCNSVQAYVSNRISPSMTFQAQDSVGDKNLLDHSYTHTGTV